MAIKMALVEALVIHMLGFLSWEDNWEGVNVEQPQGSSWTCFITINYQSWDIWSLVWIFNSLQESDLSLYLWTQCLLLAVISSGNYIKWQNKIEDEWMHAWIEGWRDGGMDGWTFICKRQVIMPNLFTGYWASKRAYDCCRSILFPSTATRDRY